MKVEFNYIKNRIAEHRKTDLLVHCQHVLDTLEMGQVQIWQVFLLMKWTYLFSGQKYPPKALTTQRFSNILNSISAFNDQHLKGFFEQKRIDQVFGILFTQQFYLQLHTGKETFATQLKLLSSLAVKYDFNKSFFEKTGLTINEFLFILKSTYLFVKYSEFVKGEEKFHGHISNDFVSSLSSFIDYRNVIVFFKLLTLDPTDLEGQFSEFKRGARKEEYQPFEMTVFTKYPFHMLNGEIKLIHKSLLSYSSHYYIYDLMKAHDSNFTTAFGDVVEKYVALGLDEINYTYKNEIEIKKILPNGSNLTDFFISDENIFIECKAIELPVLPSINPTDELIYSALEKSIFKAYSQQLLTVAKKLCPDKENWGIIVTYKEFYWSHFLDLFSLFEEFKGHPDIHHLPPENVFIIDLFSWDKVIQVVKNGQATILEILMKAKHNNSTESTRNQLFSQHLNDYKIEHFDLSYLKKELEMVDSRIVNFNNQK